MIAKRYRKPYRSEKESFLKHFYMKFDKYRKTLPKSQDWVIYDPLNRTFTKGHKIPIENAKIECIVTFKRTISEYDFAKLIKEISKILSTDSGYLRKTVDTQFSNNRLPNRRYIDHLKEYQGQDYKNNDKSRDRTENDEPSTISDEQKLNEGLTFERFIDELKLHCKDCAEKNIDPNYEIVYRNIKDIYNCTWNEFTLHVVCAFTKKIIEYESGTGKYKFIETQPKGSDGL